MNETLRQHGSKRADLNLSCLRDITREELSGSAVSGYAEKAYCLNVATESNGQLLCIDRGSTLPFTDRNRGGWDKVEFADLVSNEGHLIFVKIWRGGDSINHLARQVFNSYQRISLAYPQTRKALLQKFPGNGGFFPADPRQYTLILAIIHEKMSEEDLFNPMKPANDLPTPARMAIADVLNKLQERGTNAQVVLIPKKTSNQIIGQKRQIEEDTIDEEDESVGSPPRKRQELAENKDKVTPSSNKSRGKSGKKAASSVQRRLSFSSSQPLTISPSTVPTSSLSKALDDEDSLSSDEGDL